MTTQDYRFRITVFDKPRSGWRDTRDQAMEDAIALELASWDGEAREWFLAVPVALQREKRDPAPRHP